MIPERIKVTPVAKLTPADFEQVLRPTWAGVDACNNAAKLRRDCESVLNRAFTLGGLEKRNPASWETLKAVLPSIQAKVKQRAYLKPNEARELYRRLAADDREQCRMIRLAMLSGCRVEEILTARWDDIDYKTGCWTVPTHIDGKAVTKATRAGHFANFVPLSTAARALLGEHKGNGRVFSIRSAQTLLNVYTGYGMKGDVTNHGARSTMSDIGTEELGVALHVVEASLSHTVKEGSGASYGVNSPYFKERQKFLQAVGEFYETPDNANVVPLKAA
jgi:integrase